VSDRLYILCLDNEWLEGLGVAMQVTSANFCKSSTFFFSPASSTPLTRIGGQTAFYFGYIVRRFDSNLIGVSPNTSVSISDWYGSPNSFQPSGAYSYTGPLDNTNLTVTIITTSLNSDRAYNFEVHIGLAQS